MAWRRCKRLDAGDGGRERFEKFLDPFEPSASVRDDRQISLNVTKLCEQITELFERVNFDRGATVEVSLTDTIPMETWEAVLANGVEPIVVDHMCTTARAIVGRDYPHALSGQINLDSATIGQFMDVPPISESALAVAGRLLSDSLNDRPVLVHERMELVFSGERSEVMAGVWFWYAAVLLAIWSSMPSSEPGF